MCRDMRLRRVNIHRDPAVVVPALGSAALIHVVGGPYRTRAACHQPDYAGIRLSEHQ